MYLLVMWAEVANRPTAQVPKLGYATVFSQNVCRLHQHWGTSFLLTLNSLAKIIFILFISDIFPLLEPLSLVQE